MDVFAVEHDSVQLAWGRLPTPEMTLQIGDRSFPVGSTPPDWYRPGGRRLLPGRLGGRSGGPGALTVSGLSPSTTYDIVLSGDGFPPTAVAIVRTMDPPPGRLLARFATISDCHFGERSFAPLKRLHDPRPRPAGLEPYTIRCARGAITEAESWGADMLVAKGDLTQNARPPEVAIAVEVLRSTTLPVAIALGNHDVRGPVDTAALLREAGLEASEEASYRDLPGIRLVMGHSPIPDRHSGRLPAAHVNEVATLVAGGADGRAIPTRPAVVVMHHPLRRWPVETHYPPSISWRHSRRFASEVLAANRSVIMLSGHTHRNRLYRAGGLWVAEVGSTKDYPGQWGGYSVYEGGIRQVVRRIERWDAIAWNEMTKRALGGIWGRWSPGSLGDRCWTLHWPDRVERAVAA